LSIYFRSYKIETYRKVVDPAREIAGMHSGKMARERQKRWWINSMWALIVVL